MIMEKDTIESAITPVEGAHFTQQSTDTEKQGDGARRDYAGAQAKSDPAEIRLVRKLDIRIMVSAPF